MTFLLFALYFWLRLTYTPQQNRNPLFPENPGSVKLPCGLQLTQVARWTNWSTHVKSKPQSEAHITSLHAQCSMEKDPVSEDLALQNAPWVETEDQRGTDLI